MTIWRMRKSLADPKLSMYLKLVVPTTRTYVLALIGIVGLMIYLLNSMLWRVDHFNTLSPGITKNLQEMIGTNGIFAVFASMYYFFIFATNLALVIISAYFAPYYGKHKTSPWLYIVGIYLVWFVDMIFYVIYPVAPPIRYNSGVVRIRQNYMPWSDTLIGMKYNAFPSGHIMYLTCGLYIGMREKIKKLELWYLINLILTSFVVLYLGEHYIHDLVSGFIVALSIMGIFIPYAEMKGFLALPKEVLEICGQDYMR